MERGSVSSVETACEGGEPGGEKRIRWIGEDIFLWQVLKVVEDGKVVC